VLCPASVMVQGSRSNPSPQVLGGILGNLDFPQTALAPVFDGTVRRRIADSDNEMCIAWSGGPIGGSERAKRVDLPNMFGTSICVFTLFMRLGKRVISTWWIANSMRPTISPKAPRPPLLTPCKRHAMADVDEDLCSRIMGCDTNSS
jgi:hypothetical protein